MPKIPLAVVSSSSDDSDVSFSDPVETFRGANWAVMKIDSFDSLPFSEVSHAPYGMDSNFLDSMSYGGSAAYRPSPTAATALDRHDAVTTSLKPNRLSPRPGVPRGLRLNSTDPSLSAADVSGTAVVGLPAVPSHFSPKRADAIAPHPRRSGGGGGSGAAASSGGRKKTALPPPHRTRALQMEAAKWLEDDRSTEVLVRREVSKRRPLSPIDHADAGDVLSLSSSGTTDVLTPAERDIPPPSHLATGLQTAVTGASVSPSIADTAAAAPPQPSATAATTAAAAAEVTRGGGDRRVSALSPVNFLAVPATAAAKRLSNTTATATAAAPVTRASLPNGKTSAAAATDAAADAGSPLMLASRISMVPPRRIAPLDGKRAAEATGQVEASAAAGASPAAELTRTAMPPLRRVGTLPPTVAVDSALTGPVGSVPTTAAGERSHSAKQQRRKPRRTSLVHRSATFAETPAHAGDGDPSGSSSSGGGGGGGGGGEKGAARPGLRPKVLSPDAVAIPMGKSGTGASTTAALPSPPSEDAKGLRQRRDNIGSTTPPDADGAAASHAASAGRGAPGRIQEVQLPVAETLGLSPTSACAPVALVVDSAAPKRRPETREYSLADSLHISPVNRVAAEKLVAFVHAVSDPEVLHVIHDYLEEHQRSVPRYRLATTACRELLEQKEEMLRACLSSGGSGTEAKQSSAVFTHQNGNAEPGSPQQPDSPDEKDKTARPGDGMSEAQRLLQQVMEEERREADRVGTGDGDAADPHTDEFGDYDFCATPYTASTRFSFGQPSVSGLVTRVFAEGMLYKIKTPKAEYHFYNDTLHEVMMVRVQCRLRGNERINERAMLAPIGGTGETEITIAVLPEETNFFMSGVPHMPHFLAKRVPVPTDYVSPSVTQSLRKISADINAVRKALGKWSRASDQQAYLKCCLKNHLRFTDLNFRPGAESLCRPQLDAVAIRPVTWRRPEEYVYLTEVSQTRLFRGDISCFLVRQGDLCNHTVVAAMAAVAQFPAHVRWMFRHPVSAHMGKMERACGCYRVTLLHNAWWHNYLVDDYVPASQREPLFASCAEDPRRLWVPLLEKAYAKSLGSYAATCLVDTMEALGDFTGFPVRFLDAMWAAAAQKPNDNASRSLFRYLDRSVRAGCTVLLFTPSPSDTQSSATVDLSRKRSSRLLPVKGAVPQFLPGHIYFLRDVAFYQELDLRMVQLKNPWTWETANQAHYEKKWKYTTWYDRPDASLSVAGSVATSLNGYSSPRAVAAHPTSPSPSASAAAAVSPEAVARNERKGTMWVEWREVLAAFAGGGVCYTMWDRHRYRVRNAFVQGRPRVVLELKARRKVELFVTLSLETVSETLDNYGTVVASRPIPMVGTALSVVRQPASGAARVVSESCDDIECVTGRRTYVVARDVSMKVVVEPSTSGNGASVFVVPLLDPSAVADGAAANTTTTAPEVRCVVSLVSDAAVGDGEDLSVHFVTLRRSCGVYSDPSAPFPIDGTSRVSAAYQICTDGGVVTCEGTRITGNEVKGA